MSNNYLFIRFSMFSKENKSFRKVLLLISNARNWSSTAFVPQTIKTASESEFTALDNDLHSGKFPYYVENGLRKVYPYYYKHSTYCKGRWLKQNLVDVYNKEFSLYPREEYVKRVLKGLIRVNGKTVGLNYILKNSDLITSTVHRHELAVLATPINTLYEDDEILVVDKPPSIPVHACALYLYNTVSRILAVEYNKKSLFEIHRLDRLTSGVLIYAKSSEKSSALHEQVNLRTVEKEYLCRVEGNFPDDVVLCNRPIKQYRNKVGISLVHHLGKTCVTEFKKLSYNGKSSVVLCKPLTGRTHQIRVHLQYLGYPIVNDPLYNSYVFGPEKGKHGVINKSIEQLLKDLCEEHSSQWWLEKVPKKPITAQDIESNLMDVVTQTYCSSEMISLKKYKKDPNRFVFDDECHFCKQKHQDPKQTHLLMLLHAYKYKSDDWKFKTEIPLWAADNWCLT